MDHLDPLSHDQDLYHFSHSENSATPKHPHETFRTPGHESPPSKRRSLPRDTTDSEGKGSALNWAHMAGEIDDDSCCDLDGSDLDDLEASEEAATSGGTGSNVKGEGVEAADVADEIFEAQMLDALSQSRSAECLNVLLGVYPLLPILDPAVRREPWLGVYRKERNNRRSHAGRRWKTVLELLIVATREGWCGLDILLDPFFPHFPKRVEKVTWYPGVDSSQANLADPNLRRLEPTELLEALDECNAEGPRRNHYRDTPQYHPARQVGRVPAKFYNMRVVGDA
ncbi:unnamed protein product [Phytophthora fragariaefolia]|uniref:Unnamed protein product n=1 Tax=Phytophthora fragariaefolia TaxID=1490495 RepID=A0A9W6X412_9STRA|nr:unnamed protein product [Phytophthora fragariaefolia]